MAQAPPYYKEAAGWMLSVGLARVYAHGSPFPLHTYTDHLPLTFVRSTSGKKPVSQFVLDHLSDIDYIIEYKRGPDNKEADVVSRHPCLGPRLLTDIGTLAAVRTLLAGTATQPIQARRADMGISTNRVCYSQGHSVRMAKIAPRSRRVRGSALGAVH